MNITRKTLKRRRSNAKGKRSSVFIVVLRRESSRSKYSRNDRLEWDNLMVSNSTRTDDALVLVDFTLAELSARPLPLGNPVAPLWEYSPSALGIFATRFVG